MNPIRNQHNAPKDQFAASCPSLQPARWHIVMVPVFTYQEIGPKMCLTESTTRTTKKRSKSNFLSPPDQP
jgi:hypothetical protein